MAQDQVNGILQGLVIGQQRRAQAILAAQTQQRLQQESEYQKAEIAQRQAELQQRTKQEQLTFDLAKKMHALQSLQTEQQIGQGISKGETPAGDTKIGETTDASGNVYETHQIPGLDNPITVPSVATANKLAQAQEAAKQAPIIAGRVQEIKEGKDADLERMKAQREIQLEQAKYIQEQENTRSKAVRESEERVAGNRNATEIAIAKMHEGLGPNGEINPDIATNTLNQLRTGQLTNEQFGKLPMSPGAKKNIGNTLAATGARPISDKEQAALKALEQTKPLFDKVDQLNELIKTQGAVQLHNPFNPASQTAKELQNQIDLSAPAIASMLKESGKLTNKQLEIVDGGIHPSLSVMPGAQAANVKNRNDTLDNLRQMHESILKDLPAGQADLIRSQSNFAKIPYYGATPPSQQPQVPGQGATHIWTPQGIVPIQQGAPQ